MTNCYDFHRSLGHLTGLASRLFNNLLVSRFNKAGIDMTAEQWGVIVALKNSGAMSQSRLGERLHLDKSSISRSIDGLERRGWIERSRDTRDSRIKMVKATEEACDLASRCSSIARGVLRDAERGMGEQELEMQKTALETIISNLRQSPP